MDSRGIGGSGITASVLGFGCAGIYRVPDRRERLNLLESAWDAGFTHFDTAPMYGMGLSEGELGLFLGRRRDQATLTTKFGIRMAPVGWAAGRIQAPIRRVLARRPDANASMQKAGAGPHSGLVGGLLYRSRGYSAGEARESLHKSLRALRTDYIDIFALHDPTPGDLESAAREDLITFLSAEVTKGTLRSWAIAAHHVDVGGPGANVVKSAPIVQYQRSILTSPLNGLGPDTGRITYGALSGPLSRLESVIQNSPDLRARLQELVGEGDLRSALAPCLLREAVRSNPGGMVLYSTTRADRLAEAARSVEVAPAPGEADFLAALVAATTKI